MDWFVKAFIGASRAWFALGILLGPAIAAYPPWVAPRIGARRAPVTATGGSMFALGALGFVYNMWRTLNLADACARATRRGSQRWTET
jgi:hypothetical protein